MSSNEALNYLKMLKRCGIVALPRAAEPIPSASPPPAMETNHESLQAVAAEIAPLTRVHRFGAEPPLDSGGPHRCPEKVPLGFGHQPLDARVGESQNGLGAVMGDVVAHLFSGQAQGRAP